MDRLELKIPPPLVALLLALAMGWAARHLPSVPLGFEVRLGAALAVALIGAVFSVGGAMAFRRAHTTVNPLEPRKASALVTSGVYRVTRNPMYVGLLFVLIAWSVWLASPLVLAGPLVFVPYITRFQIRPEERVLAELFGADYAGYLRRVRRWL
ncbi:methyltransferase family protein [Variovorax terrae]|uniref:Isoprenylcysteine carboxylmethyltransferase family protein n=1 Tax=Variovorax terrae TaxID=2923278 RepID=A0A9X1VVZ0_9BURK|nr:isoprenylcysteine carboxylmethyltransferase family protein [Variovorax terrae]MCJ0764233.1 isoprenylcysteine carboxylmethyltransferase family protein [Variovorax terrae]